MRSGFCRRLSLRLITAARRRVGRVAVLEATPDTLDVVVESADPGDTVGLGPGEYFGRPLLLGRPVTILGSPTAVVRRQIQPQCADVVLLDIVFVGPFGGGAAVYGLGADRLRVIGCDVTKSREQSIMIDRCNQAVVSGCVVHESGVDIGASGHHGVYVANSVGVEVACCEFVDVAAFGIQLGPRCDEANVVDCVVDGCGQYGVTIWGGSTRSVVRESRFARCARGVATSYRAGVNNAIRDCVADRAWPSLLAGVTLTGNTVSVLPPPPPFDPGPEPLSLCEQAALVWLEAVKKPGARVKAAIAILRG